MSEWKEYKLEDAVEIITGVAFKSNEYESTGRLKVVRGENVTIGSLRWDTKKHWNKSIKGLEKYLLNEGDIVIGMDGSRVGQNRAIIRKSELPLILAQRVAKLSAKKGFNQKFIWYQILTNGFKEYVDAIHTGTSIPHISQSQIGDFNFVAPLKEDEQICIAEILGSLDDKIDLLQRQNKTLEQLAETLFRQWFVEDADESWEEGNLNSIASTIQYGYTQSASQENVGPKFLRITDIQGGVINWDAVPYCKINEKEFQKYKLKSGDIVVARTGASTGENIYLYKPEESVFASYLIRLQFSNPYLARFIGLLMRSQEYRGYIEGILSGSAQPNANASELTSFQVLVPPLEKLEIFYKIITELDEKKYQNNNQNKILTQLRDALLPKLISGEVRVNI